MLKFFRSRKQSKIIIFIIAAIILVFIFWGMWTGKKGGIDIAARVDGIVIRTQDFQTEYQRELDNYRSVLKGRFSESLLKGLNLKQRAMDTLVNRLLIIEFAKKSGISISDTTLQSTIRDIPAFHTDGVFDKDKYRQVLKYNRFTPHDFEQSLRDDLLIDAARNKELGNITVSDEEVSRTFKLENREINLQYVAIDSMKLSRDIHYSGSEAKAFFKKHKSLFRVPTRVKVIYASASLPDVIKGVKISKKDISKYYKENIYLYKIPLEVRASHILITPSGKMSSEKKDDIAARKARMILGLLKKGGDFASLAKKYSMDPGTADNGGDLGYFRKGTMMKSFDDAAFSLKKGETSDVVKTSYGYHIIKITDIKKSHTRPLPEVKGDILKKLRRDTAKKLITKRLKLVKKMMMTGKNIEDIRAFASSKGIRINETGYFSEHGQGSGVVHNKQWLRAAFSTELHRTSSPIEANGYIYIIRVEKRQDEHIPLFDEVKASVEKELLKELSLRRADKEAKSILGDLKKGKDFHLLAKKKGLTVKESGFITKQSGFIPETGLYIGNRDRIFSLEMDDPYYAEPLQASGKVYILKLKDAHEPDNKNLKNQEASIKKRILDLKSMNAFNKWLGSLRKKARIEINRKVVK